MDPRKTQVAKGVAQDGERHFGSIAAAPRGLVEHEPHLNQRLTLNVIQQVEADARAGLAFDRHPDTEAGMSLVVLEHSDAEHLPDVSRISPSAEVACHVLIAVERREPVEIILRESA